MLLPINYLFDLEPTVYGKKYIEYMHRYAESCLTWEQRELLGNVDKDDKMHVFSVKAFAFNISVKVVETPLRVILRLM